jgi:hypothetical protein
MPPENEGQETPLNNYHNLSFQFLKVVLSSQLSVLRKSPGVELRTENWELVSGGHQLEFSFHADWL